MSEPAEPRADPGRSEIVRFLAQRPPFDALAAEELSQIAAGAEIEFHLRGTVIVSEDGGPVTFLRVIHSGAVDIVHEENLLDLLGPGDTFGHAAMLSGLPPGFAARAAEDTLCYRISDTVARPLLDAARRRELAVGRGEAGTPVGRLIRTTTVTCRPSENVGTVAERMTARGATAAVVELEAGAIGIVTDRDLRSRVLARGRSGAVRIDSVMTTPVFSVAPERIASEVLYDMLERGVHHVPVITEQGRLIGMLEDADLFAAQPRSWFGTRRQIARARTVARLGEVAGRLPALMLELHRAGVPALELTRVLSALVDALTGRALELAGAAEQTVPGTVWVTVGSEARRELTFTSVRRGGLVADTPPAGDWTEQAQATLRIAGIDEPPACHDAAGWQRAALDGDPLALAVVADRRVLWGTPARALPHPDGADRDRILAQLRAQAAVASPPTGFEAGAVLRADGRRDERLDVRAAAVAPISALGRWAAAKAGSDELATPDRLRAAAQAGVMDAETAATLADAFSVALELQFGHQLQQLAAGERPDDLLDPAAMSALTRDHLRAAFHAVTTAIRGLP
ncbi:MAG TPA: putative nucleotidyltransferase substrate binding domain-containing protein [Solirubrobacteraceae bacterium]|nr:putative nucleotidyltransferase substrate binding domain-containing protein [Solirubrobacteraceae bacterium]